MRPRSLPEVHFCICYAETVDHFVNRHFRCVCRRFRRSYCFSFFGGFLCLEPFFLKPALFLFLLAPLLFFLQAQLLFFLQTALFFFLLAQLFFFLLTAQFLFLLAPLFLFLLAPLFLFLLTALFFFLLAPLLFLLAQAFLFLQTPLFLFLLAPLLFLLLAPLLFLLAQPFLFLLQAFLLLFLEAFLFFFLQALLLLFLQTPLLLFLLAPLVLFLLTALFLFLLAPLLFLLAQAFFLSPADCFFRIFGRFCRSDRRLACHSGNIEAVHVRIPCVRIGNTHRNIARAVQHVARVRNVVQGLSLCRIDHIIMIGKGHGDCQSIHRGVLGDHDPEAAFRLPHRSRRCAAQLPHAVVPAHRDDHRSPVGGHGKGCGHNGKHHCQRGQQRGCLLQDP